MDMDSSAANNSTLSENSEALEPLLTLALGASEEVNTTSSKGKSDKNYYILRSKSSTSKENYPQDSGRGVFQPTPLNSPIISPTVSPEEASKENEFPVRVVDSSEVDLNPVFIPENEGIDIVQVQAVSDTNELTNNGNPVTTEATGLVMIEQSVLEQISGFLKNAGVGTNGNFQKIMANTVTASTHITSSTGHQQAKIQNNINGSTPPAEDVRVTNASEQPTDDDEWIDTKATALQLTDQLRRYHIPQAVFARKVLNRSQGTLSDILRKPKPWNEMRLGKEIFRKMKDWLSLPEVKRIPQLRIEAAKDLDNRPKRHISESEAIRQDKEMTPKKVRRQFTESQKRALFAIFKETKKPPKEMQIALAEELELDLNTVSNFFMNARRRHTSE